MKEKKPRRSPLSKPRHLLESTRAQWVAIGLGITLLTLLCNILWRIDPAPYLQAVMLLIGAGVLGWSVDSAVKAYKVSSETSTQQEERHVEKVRREERKDEITYTEKIARPRDFDGVA